MAYPAFGLLPTHASCIHHPLDTNLLRRLDSKNMVESERNGIDDLGQQRHVVDDNGAWQKLPDRKLMDFIHVSSVFNIAGAASFAIMTITLFVGFRFMFLCDLPFQFLGTTINQWVLYIVKALFGIRRGLG